MYHYIFLSPAYTRWDCVLAFFIAAQFLFCVLIPSIVKDGGASYDRIGFCVYVELILFAQVTNKLNPFMDLILKILIHCVTTTE